MSSGIYTSEYLLILSEDIEIIESEDDLVKSLELNKNYTFKKNDGNIVITHKDLDFDLIIKKIKAKNESDRNFLITLSNKSKVKNDSDKFIVNSANKEFIKIISSFSHSRLDKLRDDLSSEFSSNGYKYIHEVENKMRKLITIFMTSKVGLGWVSSNTPQDVIDSIKNKDFENNTKNINTFLSETDFKQLSVFLFQKYSTLKTSDVHRILSKKEETIKISELTEFIPKSNWQRYFYQDFKSDNYIPIPRNRDDAQEKIEDSWNRLSDLRNKVAHNRFISFEEMRMIKSKSEEINKVIDDALNKLDSVEVTKAQINEIKQELHGTIKEEVTPVSNKIIVEVPIVADVVYEVDQHPISRAESCIRKLTKHMYMELAKPFKDELRKHRAKLNTALENYKKSPNNQLSLNMLELEFDRADEYLSTVRKFIQ